MQWSYSPGNLACTELIFLAPKDVRPDPPSSVGYRAAVAVPYREREHVGPSVSSVFLGMEKLWLHGNGFTEFPQVTGKYASRANIPCPPYTLN